MGYGTVVPAEEQMQTVVGFVLILVTLGSPVWISLVVAAVPRRLVLLDILLLVVQAIFVYGVWWFFWGGGIGCELELADGWKTLGLFALSPIVTAVAKRLGRSD
jgi:hypothetical protein